MYIFPNQFTCVMGKCIYCGRSAGLFSSKHAECVKKEQKRLADVQVRKANLVQCVLEVIQNPAVATRLKELVDEEVNGMKLTQEEVKAAIVDGWEQSVDTSLEDGVIDQEEERRLVALMRGFKFTEEELDKSGAHTRMVKAAVIRDVLSGVVPLRFNLDGPLPINLQKGEKVVWVFGGCEYWEDKTKRTYQGGSSGLSFRVMNGVYYRLGAFRGSPVESTERVLVDKGVIYITNKHIYFAGPAKSLRVPYSKIVAFQPFEDGIGITRDAQTAKPQIFKTGDGWFSYNLVTNLAALDTHS